ncbi:hypothetical protein PAXRUDRAFT_139333, partial [Paxillus rubicundulus Ve08.2h10]
EGLYFGENGEHRMRDIAVSISEALHDLGLPFLGTNSRCKANRARTLGWKPKSTTEDMLRSIKAEVEWELKYKA